MGLRPSGLSRLTQVPFGDYDLPPLRRAVPRPWLTDSAFGAAILRRSKKLIPKSASFSLNGTQLRLAKLHVTHSKDETGPASGP
jgi:hypothetical protein